VGKVREPQGASKFKGKIKIISRYSDNYDICISNENVLLQHSQLRECMGVLCMRVKLLTDLQILGCELHKNAFGGQALPGPAGGAINVTVMDSYLIF